MKLSEATRQYQDALEAHRTHEDEDSALELEKAQALMETLWLEQIAVVL